MLGITIASLTGSDSAPAKANEAKQKNDIGSAKDEVSMFVQNELTDAYEDVYVNGAAGGASIRIGNAVITAVNGKYGTALPHGNAHIQAKTNSTTGNGEITIWTTDFKILGTIDKNGGILSWGEIGANNGTTQETQIPVTSTSYTITYNANGGSGEMSATTGTNPAVATNAFTRVGYTFVKWNTSMDGSGTDYDIEETVGSDVTLYAQWQETISKATTGTGFVGYYADIDNDGNVDGIIYADMIVGNTKSGRWNEDDWSDYNITKITDTATVKDYVVSTRIYTGQSTAGKYKANDIFGVQDVLVPASNSLGTKDRFYIMALEDFKNNSEEEFFWYKNGNANQDWAISTSETDFGKGKENTINIVYDWNNKIGFYGEQITDSSEYGYNDLWGAIQDNQYNLVQTTNDSKKWFVPSKSEWSAFGEELGITTSNYSNCGLNNYYWSSSQLTEYGTAGATFESCYISYDNNMSEHCWVRLSATF